jgi:hypothetical protein
MTSPVLPTKSPTWRAKKAVTLTFLLHGREAAQRVAGAKMGVLRAEGLSTFKRWMDKFMQSSLKEHGSADQAAPKDRVG